MKPPAFFSLFRKRRLAPGSPLTVEAVLGRPCVVHPPWPVAMPRDGKQTLTADMIKEAVESHNLAARMVPIVYSYSGRAHEEGQFGSPRSYVQEFYLDSEEVLWATIAGIKNNWGSDGFSETVREGFVRMSIGLLAPEGEGGKWSFYHLAALGGEAPAIDGLPPFDAGVFITPEPTESGRYFCIESAPPQVVGGRQLLTFALDYSEDDKTKTAIEYAEKEESEMSVTPEDAKVIADAVVAAMKPLLPAVSADPAAATANAAAETANAAAVTAALENGQKIGAARAALTFAVQGAKIDEKTAEVLQAGLAAGGDFALKTAEKIVENYGTAPKKPSEDAFAKLFSSTIDRKVQKPDSEGDEAEVGQIVAFCAKHGAKDPALRQLGLTLASKIGRAAKEGAA